MNLKKQISLTDTLEKIIYKAFSVSLCGQLSTMRSLDSWKGCEKEVVALLDAWQILYDNTIESTALVVRCDDDDENNGDCSLNDIQEEEEEEEIDHENEKNGALNTTIKIDERMIREKFSLAAEVSSGIRRKVSELIQQQLNGVSGAKESIQQVLGVWCSSLLAHYRFVEHVHNPSHKQRMMTMTHSLEDSMSGLMIQDNSEDPMTHEEVHGIIQYITYLCESFKVEQERIENEEMTEESDNDNENDNSPRSLPTSIKPPSPSTMLNLEVKYPQIMASLEEYSDIIQAHKALTEELESATDLLDESFNRRSALEDEIEDLRNEVEVSNDSARSLAEELSKSKELYHKLLQSTIPESDNDFGLYQEALIQELKVQLQSEGTRNKSLQSIVEDKDALIETQKDRLSIRFQAPNSPLIDQTAPQRVRRLESKLKQRSNDLHDVQVKMSQLKTRLSDILFAINQTLTSTQDVVSNNLIDLQTEEDDSKPPSPVAAVCTILQKKFEEWMIQLTSFAEEVFEPSTDNKPQSTSSICDTASSIASNFDGNSSGVNNGSPTSNEDDDTTTLANHSHSHPPAPSTIISITSATPSRANDFPSSPKQLSQQPNSPIRDNNTVLQKMIQRNHELESLRLVTVKELEERTTECESLSSKLNSISSSSQKLQSTLSTTEAELSHLSNQYSSVVEDVEMIRNECSELRKERAILRREADRLERESEENAGLCEEAKEALVRQRNGSQREISSLKEEIKLEEEKFSTTNQKLQTEIKRLRVELEANSSDSNDERKSLEERNQKNIESLKTDHVNEIATLNEKIQDLEDDLKSNQYRIWVSAAVLAVIGRITHELTCATESYEEDIDAINVRDTLSSPLSPFKSLQQALQLVNFEAGTIPGHLSQAFCASSDDEHPLSDTVGDEACKWIDDVKPTWFIGDTNIGANAILLLQKLKTVFQATLDTSSLYSEVKEQYEEAETKISELAEEVKSKEDTITQMQSADRRLKVELDIRGETVQQLQNELQKSIRAGQHQQFLLQNGSPSRNPPKVGTPNNRDLKKTMNEYKAFIELTETCLKDLFTVIDLPPFTSAEIDTSKTTSTDDEDDDEETEETPKENYRNSPENPKRKKSIENDIEIDISKATLRLTHFTEKIKIRMASASDKIRTLQKRLSEAMVNLETKTTLSRQATEMCENMYSEMELQSTKLDSLEIELRESRRISATFEEQIQMYKGASEDCAELIRGFYSELMNAMRDTKHLASSKYIHELTSTDPSECSKVVFLSVKSMFEDTFIHVTELEDKLVKAESNVIDSDKKAEMENKARKALIMGHQALGERDAALDLADQIRWELESSEKRTDALLQAAKMQLQESNNRVEHLSEQNTALKALVQSHILSDRGLNDDEILDTLSRADVRLLEMNELVTTEDINGEDPFIMDSTNNSMIQSANSSYHSIPNVGNEQNFTQRRPLVRELTPSACNLLEMAKTRDPTSIPKPTRLK
eukprot:TRINITY_DN1346_c0_g3_i1.p1 TRINITY_DN1346_c0_g3~~TRINITY_DN1346_c0_g3_i1.p1  ORF type:complete len:1620 (-),score=589.79 TRINITY_DN1346_c0_g3_i1:184-4626(-)